MIAHSSSQVYRTGVEVDGAADRTAWLRGDRLDLDPGRFGSADPRGSPDHPGGRSEPKRPDAWPLALASCLAGVLLGDLVVYFLGFFYGEKVLSLPLTRRLLTRQREAQIKGYFHRHGFKILVSGRFVPGFRTAAYLTAGILKLPTLKLLVTDLVGGVAEHVPDVRARVRLRPPDPEAVSARCSSGSRCWRPSAWRSGS